MFAFLSARLLERPEVASVIRREGHAVAECVLRGGARAVVVVSPVHDPRRHDDSTLAASMVFTDPGDCTNADLCRVLDVIDYLPFTVLEQQEIRDQLPLTVNRLVDEYQGELPLAGHAMFLTIHHMTDFLAMVETLIRLGADPATMTVIDKEYPYKLTRRVDADLRTRIGIRVFRYRALEEAIVDHFARAERHGLRTIVMDDGGYIVPVVFDRFPHLLTQIHGLVEQTMSGIWKLDGYQLPFPLFSVAESDVKATIESYGIADSAVRNIVNLIPHEKLEGQSALVVGFGRIGRQVAQVLRARRMRVAVFDSAMPALLAAHEEGFLTANGLDDLIGTHRPLLIVGTAGRCSVNGDAIAAITRDCFLVSTTSRDYEFALDEAADASGRVVDLGRLGTRYELRAGPVVTVLAHGFPVNFHYAESLPNKYVDLVLGCMVLGAAELATKNSTYAAGGNLVRTNEVLSNAALLREYYALYGPAGEVGRVSALGTPSRAWP